MVFYSALVLVSYAWVVLLFRFVLMFVCPCVVQYVPSESVLRRLEALCVSLPAAHRGSSVHATIEKVWCISLTMFCLLLSFLVCCSYYAASRVRVVRMLTPLLAQSAELIRSVIARALSVTAPTAAAATATATATPTQTPTQTPPTPSPLSSPQQALPSFAVPSSPGASASAAAAAAAAAGAIEQHAPKHSGGDGGGSIVSDLDSSGHGLNAVAEGALELTNESSYKTNKQRILVLIGFYFVAAGDWILNYLLARPCPPEIRATGSVRFLSE